MPHFFEWIEFSCFTKGWIRLSASRVKFELSLSYQPVIAFQNFNPRGQHKWQYFADDATGFFRKFPAALVSSSKCGKFKFVMLRKVEYLRWKHYWRRNFTLQDDVNLKFLSVMVRDQRRAASTMVHCGYFTTKECCHTVWHQLFHERRKQNHIRQDRHYADAKGVAADRFCKCKFSHNFSAPA